MVAVVMLHQYFRNKSKMRLGVIVGRWNARARLETRLSLEGLRRAAAKVRGTAKRAAVRMLAHMLRSDWLSELRAKNRRGGKTKGKGPFWDMVEGCVSQWRDEVLGPDMFRRHHDREGPKARQRKVMLHSVRREQTRRESSRTSGGEGGSDFTSPRERTMGAETVTHWRKEVGLTPPRLAERKERHGGVVHNMKDPLKKLREHREAVKSSQKRWEVELDSVTHAPIRLTDKDLDYSAILRHADQKWAEYNKKQYRYN